jgi:hypothetical protein
MNSPERKTEEARAFSAADRERFHTFLKIAADSPFSGERANALDAARRLADRHGMTLEEAARAPEGFQRPRPEPPPRPPTRHEFTAREVAHFINLSEMRLRADKERYEEALQDAIARGLDSGVDATTDRMTIKPRTNGRRRNAHSFARVLLAETSLPLSEIVSLTGLDIYKVAGMKLKMR